MCLCMWMRWPTGGTRTSKKEKPQGKDECRWISGWGRGDLLGKRGPQREAEVKLSVCTQGLCATALALRALRVSGSTGH